MKNGLTWNLNYTWSKTLTNTNLGNNQTRVDALLDNARPELEKRIADTDVKHVINANYVYEFPFGRGKRFLASTPIVRDIVGGWSNSSIVHWQTGSPISLLATRGTFNRAGRSAAQTAVSNLSQADITALMGIQLVNNNLYWINPNVLDPAGTGKAIGVDNVNNTAAFAGQVFFEPMPGQLGNLGRLAFYGPRQFTWDTAMRKQTRINERFNTEFAMELINAFNHPNFYIGDQDINSTTFGQIRSMNTSARIVQFSLRLNF